MDRIIVGIRLAALVFSFYGYLQFISKKIKLEFAIAVIFSSIGSAMFLAGILNIMPEMTVIIFGAGIFLGILSIKNRESIKSVFSIGTCFFGIMGLLFLILLHHDEFVHYDNFSHWAIALKVMIMENRFPNFLDTNIGFQSYPLGSASFIYYFVKVVGIASEWMQMYAQSVLMAGMTVCLFAFAKDRKAHILVAALSIMLLCSNIAFNDLLVDTLLPLIALGGFSVCIYYKNELYKKEFFIIPFTIFLISIKNSGIFFAIIIVLYAGVCRKKELKGILQTLFIQGSIPLIVLFLWKKHVGIVYEKGLRAKHSMSVENFRAIFTEKNIDDLQTIIIEILKRIFSHSNTIVYILVFCVLLIILQKVFFHKECRGEVQIGLTVLLIYIGYQLGMLGMYLFSMPLGEAIVLAGYDRYYKTILIFIVGIVGIITISVLENFEMAKRRKSYIFALILFLISSYCTLDPNFSYYKRQNISAARLKYDGLIQEYRIPQNSSYLIILESNGSSYLGYMSRYLLLPERLICYNNDLDCLEKIEKQWKEFDYLILYDSSEEISQWIRQKFQTEDKVISLSEYR